MHSAVRLQNQACTAPQGVDGKKVWVSRQASWQKGQHDESDDKQHKHSRTVDRCD